MPQSHGTFQAPTCSTCEEGFHEGIAYMNYNGKSFHKDCFCCEQCFKLFDDESEIFSYDGKRYCGDDYKILYAPQCHGCSQFIIDGQVLIALNVDWCRGCFRCARVGCEVDLTECFVSYDNKLLCQSHYTEEKAKKEGKPICQKCFLVVDGPPLRWKGDPYHPYHFHCNHCLVMLDHTGRDIGGKLYCLPCHDKMGIPICAACRRPVEGRCVNACGKQWHPEHFVCSTCERSFSQSKYFLGKDGSPYCEKDYNKLYGDVCHHCNNTIQDEVISALEKRYCGEHFRCSSCHCQLNIKDKFIEFDMKPLCKKCFDHFPSEMKKRFKKHSRK